MSSVVQQAIVDGTGVFTSVVNAGVAGANYNVFAPPIAANNGLVDSDWYFWIRGEQGGVAIADVRRYITLSAHFYLSNSTAAPANAAAVATFTSDDRDLLPDRPAKAGYRYLATVSKTFLTELVLLSGGATYNIYLSGVLRHTLAQLNIRGVAAADRLNVVCICIADQSLRDDTEPNLSYRVSVDQKTQL